MQVDILSKTLHIISTPAVNYFSPISKTIYITALLKSIQYVQDYKCSDPERYNQQEKSRNMAVNFVQNLITEIHSIPSNKCCSWSTKKRRWGIYYLFIPVHHFISPALIWYILNICREIQILWGNKILCGIVYEMMDSYKYKHIHSNPQQIVHKPEVVAT